MPARLLRLLPELHADLRREVRTLSALQVMQQQTTLSQVERPPRDRGFTWSRFRSFVANFLPAVLAAVLVAEVDVLPVNRTSCGGSSS